MTERVDAFRRWRTISESAIPSTAKAVLLALALHADAEWTARPSQGKLSTCTSLTPRGVRKALAWLEAEGLLTRRGIHGPGVVLYQLQVTEITAYTPERGSGTPERGSARNVVPTPPERGSGSPRNVVPTNQPREPTKEPTTTRRASPALPRWVKASREHGLTRADVYQAVKALQAQIHKDLRLRGRRGPRDWSLRIKGRAEPAYPPGSGLSLSWSSAMASAPPPRSGPGLSATASTGATAGTVSTPGSRSGTTTPRRPWAPTVPARSASRCWKVAPALQVMPHQVRRRA